MFTIRPAHLKAFKDELVHRYVLSIIPDIKQRYANIIGKMSNTELMHYLTQAVLRAENYGFSDTKHIFGFIVFMFETAPDIDTQPGAVWLRKVLHHSRLKAEEKLQILKNLLVPHQFKKTTIDRVLGVNFIQPENVQLTFEIDPEPNEEVRLTYKLTNNRDSAILVFYGYYDGKKFQSSFDLYWQTPAVLHVTKRLWHSLSDSHVKNLIFPLFLKLDPGQTWEETVNFPSPLTLHLPKRIDKKVPKVGWEDSIRLSGYLEMSISVLIGPIDDLVVIGMIEEKTDKSTNQPTLLYGFNTPPYLAKHYIVQTFTASMIEAVQARK